MADVPAPVTAAPPPSGAPDARQNQQPAAAKPAAPMQTEAQRRQANGQFTAKLPIQDSQREDGAPPPPPVEKPSTRKYKLKVDGQESEIELDDDGVTRELQMSVASRKRMQEAATIKQREARMLQAFKDKDFDALGELGVNLDEISSSFLLRQAQRAMVPPEQLALEEAQRQHKTTEAELAAYKKREEDAKLSAADDATWKQIEPELIAAAESEGLPKDFKTMELIASVGLEFLDAGVALTPKQIAQEVARRQGTRSERYVLKPLKEGGGKAVLAWLRKNGLYDGLIAEQGNEYRTKTGAPPLRAVDAPASTDKAAPIVSTADWKRAMKGSL